MINRESTLIDALCSGPVIETPISEEHKQETSADPLGKQKQIFPSSTRASPRKKFFKQFYKNKDVL